MTSTANSHDASADSALSDSTLGSTIFARLQPATYLSRFLRQNIRPDGRAFDDVRAVQVGSSTIGTAHGSAIVRHGGTIIVAGVKGEWLDTSDEEEHDGSAEVDGDDDDDADEEERRTTSALAGLGPVQRRRVVVSVDLTPMSSARFKPGPPGEEAQVLASHLMALLDAAPPLSALSLRIAHEGGTALSWCLYVDLVCIAYDGNALDACMMAINAAMQDTKLPNVVRDEESGVLQCQAATAGVALEIKAQPLSFSYGIVHDAYLLSDPNAFESTMVAAWITITLDAASVSDAGEHDVVAVRCSGRCSALISSEEASRANVQGSATSIKDNFDVVANDDFVRVADEGLLKVCMARAQKQCATLKQSLTPSR